MSMFYYVLTGAAFGVLGVGLALGAFVIASAIVRFFGSGEGS